MTLSACYVLLPLLSLLLLPYCFLKFIFSSKDVSIVLSNKSLLAVPTYKSNYHSKQLSYALVTSSVFNVGDRFIPRRRGVNVEASRYHLLCNNIEKDIDVLDVFEEIKSATEHWRKKYMDSTFQIFELFKGIRNKRILNIGSSSSAAISCSKSLKMQELNEDGGWACQPRKMPLMNMRGESSKHYRDHGAQIFRFVTSIRFKNLIDWGARNILACGLADRLCIYEADSKSFSGAYSVSCDSYVCCVKWNPEGTQVAASSVDGSTCLYDQNYARIIWSRQCECYMKTDKKCKVNCTVWVKKCKHIITGCDSGRLSVINAKNGKQATSMVFEKEIVSISISPIEQYLAVSGDNKLVTLFNYPSLVPLFEIIFYASVKAMAWHPWQTSVLCLGGGLGDGSLSLWNVSKQRQLGYRKVKFIGSVDYLAFNRLSGELLVHWYYLENHRLRSKIAVLASLGHIVDAVPIQPEHRMVNIAWSPDHTKIAMQHRDTLVIWNFFGDKPECWTKLKKCKSRNDSSNCSARSNNSLENYEHQESQSLTNPMLAKSFDCYNIR